MLVKWQLDTGTIHILEWVRARRYPWNVSHVFRLAAFGGHQDVLQWARTNGFPREANAYAELGAVKILSLGRTHVLQCWLGQAPGHTAVGAGARLSMGRAHVRRCCNGRASGYSAVGAGARLPMGRAHVRCYCRGRGHLGILQWARAQTCPWDDDMCYGVFVSGKEHEQKWGRLNGCPAEWPEEDYGGDLELFVL